MDGIKEAILLFHFFSPSRSPESIPSPPQRNSPPRLPRSWQPTSPSPRLLSRLPPPPTPSDSSSSSSSSSRNILQGLLADWRFGYKAVTLVASSSRPGGFEFLSGAVRSSVLQYYERRRALRKMSCTRGSRLFPLWLCAMVCLMAQPGACNVVLMANNTTLSFEDVEATFTPAVEGSRVHGVIYTVEPLDACSPLRKKAADGPTSSFALIIRGGCQFDDKVRNAQKAGFKAVMVYDNEESGLLVSMAGSSSGIHIYAVFLSKASGEVLKKYSGQSGAEFWIIPTYENSAWSIMTISFIALLAMSAVLATCFFVRRLQIRRDRSRILATREFHGMSSQLVKAMPSLIFTKVQEDNSTSSSCAICLEDYSFGEKLRVLPCRHKFHATCVDMWLTSWKTFCPVCKRDASAGTSNTPASESTPLLSSAISGIPRTSNPHRSYSISPAISASRSNVDLASMASPWSHTSHLASTHSLGGGHLSPPVNIRYTLPHGSRSRSEYGSACLYIGLSHIPPSGHGSPSYHPSSLGQQPSCLRRRTESGPSLFTMVPQSPQQNQLQHGGESGTSLSAAASTQSMRQAYLQHCPDSDASQSAMTSAQSLPGC